MSWKCDNCRNVLDDEAEKYYCDICGAVVCCSCVSDDNNICLDCEE